MDDRKPWIRDEIETIIKECKLDRRRFHECAKNAYAGIIRKFYYTFIDTETYPDLSLAYCWLHFRKSLTVRGQIDENAFLWCDNEHRQYIDWPAFLQQLRTLLPMSGDTDDQKCYLLLSEGWVYEGYPNALFAVLEEADGIFEDFYLISAKFDWCAAYCRDGEYATIFEK